MDSLHYGVKRVRAIAPAAVGTTGAGNGSLSAVIDRANFEHVEAVISYGTAGATGDTVTPILYEGDATGSMTAVADADMLSQTAGTAPEAAAALPAEATARTSGVGKNVTKKIGYIGRKRYVQLRLYGLGTATAIVSAVWEFSGARKQPVATS